MNIVALPGRIFAGLHDLEELHLGRNKIAFLPSGIFSDLQSIQYINLSFQRNSASPLSLREDVFSGLHTLRSLELSNNRMTGMPSGIFSGLYNLERLDLDYNTVGNLPEGLFAGLRGLKGLYIQSMGLTEVANNLFAGLSSLELLYLFKNKLTGFQKNVFEPLTSLETLYVSGNPLVASVSLSATVLSLPPSDESSGTYEVVLNAPARGQVTVELTNGDPERIRVEPSSLNFSGVVGWNVPQTVTVTRLKTDNTQDETVVISHALTQSTDHAGKGLLEGGLDYQNVSVDDVTVTLEQAVAVNAPATGLPTVSGTPMSGETLTASADGVSDADGLASATFVWQWISNDGTSDADIDGATDASYTLTDGEIGKTIKVRVTFTDDGGSEETLVSDATEVVEEPLTASFLKVPESHDGTPFTFELRFGEAIVISYLTLRDSAFDIDGGSVTRARRLDRPSNLRWEITVAPDGERDLAITLERGPPCGAPKAICTADGRGLAENVATAVARGTTVAGPTVTGVSVSSDPGADRRWSVGESVEIAVEFSETVTVDLFGRNADARVLDLGRPARGGVCERFRDVDPRVRLGSARGRILARPRPGGGERSRAQRRDDPQRRGRRRGTRLRGAARDRLGADRGAAFGGALGGGRCGHDHRPLQHRGRGGHRGRDPCDRTAPCRGAKECPVHGGNGYVVANVRVCRGGGRR